MKTHWKMTVSALAVAVAAALPAAAQKPDVAAAEKEGKVVWYTSVDVKVAEDIAQEFRRKYPKIEVEVERSGSERVFQRENEEHQSGIKHADLVNTSDSTHFITMDGGLANHGAVVQALGDTAVRVRAEGAGKPVSTTEITAFFIRFEADSGGEHH